ncbi:MAG: YgiQ family radical SAM protein [Chloroflexota bacterium]|nr:YgiQ family radical SAM protein [Chloroflexota bacterium]
MFLPTTQAEVNRLGWDCLDIILITGDSYIDSPFMGVSVIGSVLQNAGYKVGVIAQPDYQSGVDITRLGEPRLFWGVTAGSIDSMVANYTATGRPRRLDDYTPGGRNTKRPNRATLVYANLIRRYFKNTVPIVLGGVEASLRRIAHYDFWSDAIRRSVLFDSKADYLLYGMAEGSVLALAQELSKGKKPTKTRGLCFIAKSIPPNFLELPSFETVSEDKDAFTEMFHTFYHNNAPMTAKGLAQRHGDRYLVQNPPYPYLTQKELDQVYDLEYEREQHPYYSRQGEVKALETIRFSIPTHRGCYGECNFCAIAVHEGRTVRWRSEGSILAEAQKITHLPDFKGFIYDLSGPTSNMYGFECPVKLHRGPCEDKSCLYPKICPTLPVDHQNQIELLRKIRQIKGIKKVFVGSGLRYDLLLSDREHGETYLKELVGHHISGQMKIAPEHAQPEVLARMRKPDQSQLLEFKQRFDAMNKKLGKKQFLSYYLIAAYPGCTLSDMQALKRFASHHLGILPEQVQVFTPTPSTYASVMYHTEKDPFTGEKLFVEKNPAAKQRQKETITGHHRPPKRHRSKTDHRNKKKH